MSEYMAARMDDQITGAQSENERLADRIAELEAANRALQNDADKLANCDAALHQLEAENARLREDADCFLYLTAEFVGDERKDRNALIDRMAVMSYAATKAQIWANISEHFKRANTQAAAAAGGE